MTTDVLSPVAADLRQRDPDRFFTSLLAPAGARDDLIALYALDVELRGIRAQVSEPMLGRIRLQWWFERVQALREGSEQPNGPPLLYALNDLMARRSLPGQGVCDVFCARSNDMEEPPILDRAFFQQYVQGTGGSIAAIAYAILGGGLDDVGGEAARLAGAVWETAHLLRSVLTHAGQGVLMLPLAELPDSITVVEDIATAAAVRDLAPLVQSLAVQGLETLATARRLCPRPPKGTVAAFLPASIAETFLARLARNGGDLLDARLHVPQRRPLTLLWRNLRGVY